MKSSSSIARRQETPEDARTTSLRLVINPEKMVIKEAQRAYTFFSLFGYAVDMIIVNRVIPASVEDPYFQKWKSIQESYLRLIEESFSPVPIFAAELANQEIVGRASLEKMGDSVYRGQAPAPPFSAQKPLQIEKENGCFVLSLHLPFVEKSDLDLFQKGGELC